MLFINLSWCTWSRGCVSLLIAHHTLQKVGGVSNPYKIMYNYYYILHKMHVYCYTLLCCMVGIIHNLLLMCFYVYRPVITSYTHIK